MKRIESIVVTTLLAAVMPIRAHAQDRMPAIPADKMTDAQRQAVTTAVPQGNLPLYLVPFLRSPEVMLRVNGLGDYVVRGKTALSRRQSEFVILLVVRHWTQQYMWSNHYQAAIHAGVLEDVAKAIGEGRRPARLADDEQVLYDFCGELQHNLGVSDPTYARMVGTFGEQGVIDTIGLAGYYTVLSMAFNTSRMPLTPGGPVLTPMPLGAR